MNNKRLVLDTLIGMVQKGYDVSSLVGQSLANKIGEIASLESLDDFENRIYQLMIELDLDENELALNNEFKKIELEKELEALKKKMKPLTPEEESNI